MLSLFLLLHCFSICTCSYWYTYILLHFEPVWEGFALIGIHTYWYILGSFGRASYGGLLVQSRSHRAGFCGSCMHGKKTALAPLFFLNWKMAPCAKHLAGSCRLEPLQKPCLTGPLALLSGLWRALANSSSLDYSFLQWKIKHNPTLNICISLDCRQFITFQCTSTPWKFLSF